MLRGCEYCDKVETSCRTEDFNYKMSSSMECQRMTADSTAQRRYHFATTTFYVNIE